MKDYPCWRCSESPASLESLNPPVDLFHSGYEARLRVVPAPFSTQQVFPERNSSTRHCVMGQRLAAATRCRSLSYGSLCDEWLLLISCILRRIHHVIIGLLRFTDSIFQGKANEALHSCVESLFPKHNSNSKHNRRLNSIMKKKKTPNAYTGPGFCCLQ